jgi:hypothetical protein
VRQRARQRLAEAEGVLRAIGPSWALPPYDPWLIAQALGIRCIEVQQESFRGAMICVRAGDPSSCIAARKTRRAPDFRYFTRSHTHSFLVLAVDPCPRALAHPCSSPTTAVADFSISYAAYSARCREQGWFPARQLTLPKSSCLRSVARSGKAATGRQQLALLSGDPHTFRIEALPLTDRPRRKGRRAVLAFIYPD